jgi:deoxyribonuclease-1-like protein
VSLGNNTLKIASWNIQDLGRSKNAEEINSIAKILRNFDLVAIQEVVAKDPAGAQAVTKIVDELNRMGSKWDYQISNPTKSPSVYMSERYAFLW